MRLLSCSTHRADSERGTIIVLTAICIVALLAMGALAIDAGALYKAQLVLQNSADAGALAGVDLVVRTSLAEVEKEMEELKDPNMTIEKYVYERVAPVVRANMIRAGYPHGDGKYEIKIAGPTWKRKSEEGKEVEYKTFALNDVGESEVFTVSVEVSRHIDSYFMHLLPFVWGEAAQGGRTLTAFAQAGRKIANIAVIFDVSESMNCPALGSCLCQNFKQAKNCSGTSTETKMDYLVDGLRTFLKHFDILRDRIIAVPFNIRATPFSIQDMITKPETLNLPAEQQHLLEALATNVVDHYRTKGYLPDEQIDALITLAKGVFKKKPNGLTNICDAFQRTWDFIQSNTNNIGMAGNEVAYVLFSDGAPTAASVSFANPKGALASWGGTGRYDYTSYQMQWVNQDVNVPAPSILLQTDLLTLGYDSSYPPDPGTGESEIGVTSPAGWASCSIPAGPTESDPYKLIPPVYNETEAANLAKQIFGNCLNDMGFSMPKNLDGEYPKETYGSDYGGGGAHDWDDWRKLYYNCAVQLSDHLRSQKGMFYVVGLGDAAPEPESFTPADPYQNIDDTVSLKTALLRRIANDQYLAVELPQKEDPSFTPTDFQYQGYEGFTAIDTEHAKRGKFLHAKTVHDIEVMFELIAQQILLKLYQ